VRVCFTEVPSTLKNVLFLKSERALTCLKATASSVSLSKRAVFTKKMSFEHSWNNIKSANSEANGFSLTVKKFCVFYEK